MSILLSAKHEDFHWCLLWSVWLLWLLLLSLLCRSFFPYECEFITVNSFSCLVASPETAAYVSRYFVIIYFLFSPCFCRFNFWIFILFFCVIILSFVFFIWNCVFLLEFPSPTRLEFWMGNSPLRRLEISVKLSLIFVNDDFDLCLSRWSDNGRFATLCYSISLFRSAFIRIVCLQKDHDCDKKSTGEEITTLNRQNRAVNGCRHAEDGNKQLMSI